MDMFPPSYLNFLWTSSPQPLGIPADILKIRNQENFHFLLGLYNPKQTFASQNRVPNQIRKLQKLSDAQDPC
ncbi:hypothetical protein [Citrus blight-associated pararetrovirus]|nr:hypothetical protein [Citrus blight-associated pararetrovirus]